MAASAQDASAAWPQDAVEVGRIAGAWGIQGGIKVLPFSGDPQALFSSRRWFVRPPENDMPARRIAWPEQLRITSAREQGEFIVATVQEIVDRNAAEAMRGGRLFIARSSFPNVDPGEFYWVDLIGLAVVNRQGERLGRVSGLLDTGAHSVLRVVAEEPAEAGVALGAGERLIPFVAAYIDDVSLEQRLVTVDWGLDY